MRKRKILVIDDDLPSGLMVGEFLGALNYEIVYAYDGLGAHVLAQKERPDLIISDYRMPAANGDVLVKRLAADPGTSAIPVFFVSGEDAQRVAPTLVGGPRVLFFSKPVNLQILLAHIKRVLGPDSIVR